MELHFDKDEHGLTSPQLPEGVKNYMIDIDGTITEDVPNEEPERMGTVLPYNDCLEIINSWYDEGHIITFFTSRVEEHREVTEKWLNQHGFKYHGLLMGKPRFGKYVWIDNLDVTGIKFDSTWKELIINNKLFNE